jgi:ubiquinone/menaquinone biosynthesis C-methylase UbiE
MHCDLETNVGTFNEDVVKNGGYLYTTNARLSSRFANDRITDAMLALAAMGGKRVLDVGCGDGACTREIYDRGRPASMVGIDPARDAIDLARTRAGGRPIEFREASAYDLPFPDDHLDQVHLRGVLHHLDRPIDALREALRVARSVVVVEPNGYNPVLKLLERYSPYHVEHEEKSYAPRTLDRWVRDLGAGVRKRSWVGLVPFFCPDGFARLMKRIEPLGERIPLVRAIGCGQYVFVAERVL